MSSNLQKPPIDPQHGLYYKFWGHILDFGFGFLPVTEDSLARMDSFGLSIQVFILLGWHIEEMEPDSEGQEEGAEKKEEGEERVLEEVEQKAEYVRSGEGYDLTWA